MVEGKDMLYNVKSVVNGSNPRVRKRSKIKIMDSIREDIKYLVIFILLYTYWQVVLWILVKNSKRKSEHP